MQFTAHHDPPGFGLAQAHIDATSTQVRQYNQLDQAQRAAIFGAAA